MLNDMDKKTEHALDALKKQAREDSLKMGRDEAADSSDSLPTGLTPKARR